MLSARSGRRRLTPAESAVAELLATGCSAAELACRQGVAVGTAGTHNRVLLEKTGTRSQVALLGAITRRP